MNVHFLTPQANAIATVNVSGSLLLATKRKTPKTKEANSRFAPWLFHLVSEILFMTFALSETMRRSLC